MSTRTYYIAEVSGKYNDTSNFEIKPFVGYLVDSEGYNTVSCYFTPDGKRVGAKKFEDPLPFRMKEISNPWYYKVEKLRWIKVTETFEQQEEYV